MKTLSIALLLTGLLCSCRNDYRIVRVKDGDTVVMDNGEVVRLYNVDAPELAQAYGAEAKAFTASYLLHKKVSIIKIDTDKYNRKVAKVYLADGTYFNELLLRRGYAYFYSKFSHDQEMKREMETARRNKIGLWAKENVAPYIFRKTHKK